MIYSSTDLDLIDCEYLENSREFTNGFLQKFNNELQTADRLRHFTTTPSKSLSYHVDSGEHYNNDMHENEINVDAFGMRNLTYTQLRTDNDIPHELRPLMHYDVLKAQCDATHERMLRTIEDMKSQRRNAKQPFDDEDGSERQSMSRYKTKTQIEFVIWNGFSPMNIEWCLPNLECSPSSPNSIHHRTQTHSNTHTHIHIHVVGTHHSLAMHNTFCTIYTYLWIHTQHTFAHLHTLYFERKKS